MNVRRNASQDANDWADKKRLQVEKAKQLREERKQTMMRVAEHDIVGSSSGFGAKGNQGLKAGGGGYSQDFNNTNQYQYGQRNNYQGMGSYQNDQFGGIQQTPSQFGTGNYSQYMGDPKGSTSSFNTIDNTRGGMGAGGMAGYSQGGYQKANGPVRAVDLGFNTGYSNQKQMNGGGYGQQQQQQYQQYDQYENAINSGISTKSSLQTVSNGGNNGTNYRKAFNPNSQLQNSDYNNGFKQTSTSSYYEPQQKEPMNQQRRSVPANVRNNQMQQETQERRYDNLPKAQVQARQTRTIEEQKYEYQPQKREAPTRKVPQQSTSNQYTKNQTQSQSKGYQNYDNEVEQQVIPTVKNKGGFANNLPPDAFQKPVDMDLSQCPSCQRSFNLEAYQKHVKICKKVFVQKRKEFNSQSKRIVSTEQKQILLQAKRQDQHQQKAQAQPARGNNQPIKGSGGGKGAKWKAQSEMFRAAMRAARVGDDDSKGGKNYGGGSNNYAAAEQYDDRTPCPYCGRKFNDTAAQRHIPYCQNKSKVTAMKGGPPKGGKGGHRR